jgi:dTDP-4-amino-4,6-dideoxygalactose transaminase
MVLRHQLAVYSPITVSAGPRAVVAALRLGADPRPRLLDAVLREYAATDGVLCGSGTQALQIAITVAMRSIGERTPVALPAFSCFDVASAAIGADTRIALYDLDPSTLGPSVESLDRVLAGGVRVVVVSPLYGIPVEWEALESVAARYGAILIEDAAQGHGASWRGQRLGTLGRISTLSFGRGKGWTGGAGGAVLFRDKPVSGLGLSPATFAKEMTAIVGSLAQFVLGRPSLYGIPRSVPALGLGSTTYRPPADPLSMTRAAAGAALANARASLVEAARRRDNARHFVGQLGALQTTQAIEVGADADPGYLRFPVRVSRALDARIDSDRARRLGIERSYPISLGDLAAAGTRLVGEERRWPGAASLVAELATLPTHSRLSISERDEIVQLLRG